MELKPGMKVQFMVENPAKKRVDSTMSGILAFNVDSQNQTVNAQQGLQKSTLLVSSSTGIVAGLRYGQTQVCDLESSFVLLK